MTIAPLSSQIGITPAAIASTPSDIGRYTMPDSAESDDLFQVSDACWAASNHAVAGEAISLDRCIDWLLDVRTVAPGTQIETLVDEVLEDITELLAYCDQHEPNVDPELEDAVLGAMASIEAAFDFVNGR